MPGGIEFLLTEFACACILVYMIFNFICSPDGCVVPEIEFLKENMV